MSELSRKDLQTAFDWLEKVDAAIAVASTSAVAGLVEVQARLLCDRGYAELDSADRLWSSARWRTRSSRSWTPSSKRPMPV